MKVDIFGLTRRAQEGSGGSDRISMQPEGHTLLPTDGAGRLKRIVTLGGSKGGNRE